MTDKCDSINIIYFLQFKVLFISIIQEITRCNALCLPWIRTKSKMRFNFISFIPVTNEKVLIMIYNGIKRIIRRVGSRLILLTLKRKKKCDRISNSGITITRVLYEGSINESETKCFTRTQNLGKVFLLWVELSCRSKSTNKLIWKGNVSTVLFEK